MKHAVLFCIGMLLIIPVVSEAQTLKDLRDAALGGAKTMNTKENRNKVTNAVFKEMDKARASFDSTDFDYAILLSDNSGLFDIKEKGEASAQASSVVNVGSSIYKNATLSDADRARASLQLGELFYGYQKFSMAEKKYDNAKKSFEQAGLTDDLGYVKTVSNEGLLYATMGRYTQAEEFTAQALELRKAKYGEGSVGLAASLNNYGVLKYNLARYNEAEKDFETTLAIFRSNNLQQSMSYAIALNNEAMLYETIGRF